MFESGQVVGDRYRLEGRLGDNESRQTWLGAEVESGELVVLKILALNGLTQWDDVKFLEREADTLRSLDHPQLPKFRDYVTLPEKTGWFALVTDYIPGVSLKEKLQQRYQFSIEEIEAIARSILGILDYLHHHRPPILHRDVKPSNLISGEDGEIYLIDFGAVQNQPRKVGATFTVAGTYGYTPIEQFGGQTSPASDLYALGATLVHLLTGIAPMDLPQSNFRLQFRDRLPEELSQEWVDWLETMTAPDVTDRYQSVTTALNELLELQRDRRRGNISRRSPQPIASDFPDHFLSDGDQDCIAITDEGDRILINMPSPFTVQVVQGGRVLLNDLLKIFNVSPTQIKQLQSKAKASNFWRIGLMMAIFSVIVGPRPFIGLILGSVTTALTTFIAALPFIVIAAIVLPAVYPGGYFNSALLALSSNQYVLKIRGLSGRRLSGYLRQIESCEVVRLDSSDNTKYALAIAIVPEGVWRLKKRPEIHLVGRSLPLDELEKAAQRIRSWLQTNNPKPS
ncbi:MAG: serine/threonine-protein kinase [Cyanobacteria bacterium P01_D01_bin.73]